MKTTLPTILLFCIALVLGATASARDASTSSVPVTISLSNDPIHSPADLLKATFDVGTQNTIALGFKDHPVWLKLGTESLPAEFEWLIIRPGYTDSLTLYHVTADGTLWQLGAAGDAIAQSNARLVGGFSFQLPANPGPVYAKVTSENLINLEANAHTTHSFLNNERLHLAAATLVLSFSLIFLILAGIGRHTINHRLTQFFMLRQAVVMVAYGVHSGLVAPIADEQTWFDQNLAHNVTGLIFISITQMFDFYLLNRSVGHRWLMWGLVATAVLLPIKLAIAASGQWQLALLMNNLSVLSTTLILAVAAIGYAVLKKDWPVNRYWVLAYFLMVVLTPLTLYLAQSGQIFTNWSYSDTAVIVTTHMIALGGIILVIVKQHQRSQLAQAQYYRQMAFRREREREELSDLLHMLSHEVKTPLAVLALSEDTSERHRQAYDDLELLVNQIQSLSRLENEPSPLEHEPVSINTEVKRAVSRFLHEGAFNVHVPATLFVVTHPSLLKLILNNAISNASRYRAEGSTVDIWASEQDQSLVLRLSNQLDKPLSEDANTLVAKFKRGKNSSSTSGSGLGLYLIEKSVRKLNGELALTSDGLRFNLTIKLPSTHP